MNNKVTVYTCVRCGTESERQRSAVAWCDLPHGWGLVAAWVKGTDDDPRDSWPACGPCVTATAEFFHRPAAPPETKPPAAPTESDPT